MYNICEIYTFEGIHDVAGVLDNFAKVCKVLLDKGVTRFVVRTQNRCSNLCCEILRQYNTDNIIDISIEPKPYNHNDIKGYVVLFNHFGMVTMFDKGFMPTILTDDFARASAIADNFSNIELLQ